MWRQWCSCSPGSKPGTSSSGNRRSSAGGGGGQLNGSQLSAGSNTAIQQYSAELLQAAQLHPQMLSLLTLNPEAAGLAPDAGAIDGGGSLDNAGARRPRLHLRRLSGVSLRAALQAALSSISCLTSGSWQCRALRGRHCTACHLQLACLQRTAAASGACLVGDCLMWMLNLCRAT
jgi:hypothetical protein